MNQVQAQQAHREGRRGRAISATSSVAAAPHAGRWHFEQLDPRGVS